MFTSLSIFVLVVCALSVNGQRQYGSNCRNVNCASSQQCLGLYEQCKTGLVEGSTCGFYATCVDLDGEVKHSERPASVSNVGNDAKPIQRESVNVSSSDKTTGQLYPSLPQPDYPSSPNTQGGFNSPTNQQGGYNPPNPQGGYYPPNRQGGYYPPNQQGGSYPPNPQGGYPPNPQGGYPPNPQGYPNYPSVPESSGNKKESGSDSGFGSSILNFFSGGGNRESSTNSGGPDLGSLLSILGKGNSGNTNSGSSGSGELDFSSLLSSFTGGQRGNSQNTRNDFDNRNPSGQVGPNPSYGANNGQNPNQSQDNGPGFLQTLGNFATSPLGQQLLVNALRSKGNENDAQQSRRYGGLFSENNIRTTETLPDATSRRYPTQPPYTP